MAINIGGNTLYGSSSNGLYQDCRIDNLIVKRPAAMLSNSAGIVYIPTVYPFNTTSLSYNNSGANTASNRYTANESGVYFAMFRCMSENNAYASDYYMIFQRNGGYWPSLCYTSNLGAYHMEMHIACVAYLNTGDYLDVYAQYGHDFYGSNQRYTRLVVFRIA